MHFEPVINFYPSLLGEESYQSYGMEGLMESFSDRQGTGLAYVI